uniref:Cytochrome b561 and DOMON domain-containing protein n=1 Tax=Davidia involucrata TaxID=16924 RepID=A0A5B7BXX4_DAVIN
MAKMFTPVLFSCVLISLFLSSSAQSCSKYTFASNKVFSACNDLPNLNSFLHWTYNPTSGTAQIAYRHNGITSAKWVAWGINPKSKGMVGTQALVAFQQSDGTMKAYTSPVTSYRTNLQEGNLDFAVSDLSATYKNNEITIFATLKLPSNTTTVNHVWQDGPLSGTSPGMHDTSGPNVQSMGSLNILSGQSVPTTTATGGNSKTKKRNIHGVLNAVSWGIMMPLGAIIARYLKVFKSADPAWFYLHITCQTSAYIIGVAGWATGLQLGSESPGIQYSAHRTIGIVLFCLGTLQVFALLLRPNKDHKYRFYWNIYHHSVGYTVIILSITNIFKGFNILNPEKKWEKAYITAIVVLAFAAVVLEAFTWFVVLKRKKSARTEKTLNGTNGFNGYGAGTQQGV